MILSSRSLLLCAAATLLVAVAGADNNSSKPVAGWGTLTDPEGDCTVKAEKGKLSITVPGGTHDLNAALGGMTAPRVLREVEGDFTAQVKVTSEFDSGKMAANANTRPFVSAGLILWQNEKNYVRLERNAFWVDEQSVTVCYPPLIVLPRRRVPEHQPAAGSRLLLQGSVHLAAARAPRHHAHRLVQSRR
jgi:hypothetical protein